MAKVINKAYKRYNRISRYSSFPYYYNVTDEKYMYGTTGQLSTETPFVVYTTKDGDTLDIIALEHYNNPTYFWIIADFNRIQDPYVKFKAGVAIKVPTYSSIEFII